MLAYRGSGGASPFILNLDTGRWSIFLRPRGAGTHFMRGCVVPQPVRTSRRGHTIASAGIQTPGRSARGLDPASFTMLVARKIYGSSKI